MTSVFQRVWKRGYFNIALGKQLRLLYINLATFPFSKEEAAEEAKLKEELQELRLLLQNQKKLKTPKSKLSVTSNQIEFEQIN